MARLSQEDIAFVEKYDDSKYAKPSVTADIILFSVTEDRTRVLLIKRGGSPYKGCYAFPGGYGARGETIDETASRELQEETGLEGLSASQFRVYSTPGRDPRGWVITVAFLSVLRDVPPEVHADDDATDAKWFDVSWEADVTGLWTIRLESGAEQISYAARMVRLENESGEKGDWRAEVSEADCPLAFDHGVILAEALWYVRERLTEKSNL